MPTPSGPEAAIRLLQGHLTGRVAPTSSRRAPPGCMAQRKPDLLSVLMLQIGVQGHKIASASIDERRDFRNGQRSKHMEQKASSVKAELLTG